MVAGLHPPARRVWENESHGKARFVRQIRSPVDAVKNSPQAGQTWRTLTICNIDTMAYKLLLPWLRGLRAAGCAITVACRCGAYADRLRAEEFTLYHVPMRREAKNPFAHLPALVALIRLLRSQEYDLVMVHSLVGATVGRAACLFAGQRPVMYCVHGMYVTQRTGLAMRLVVNAVEKVLSYVTDTFVFVSQEDLAATRKSGLVKATKRALWACGSVDRRVYRPDEEARCRIRARCGFGEECVVVGIVARIVREKGFREFFEMAAAVAQADSRVHFLVVGDSLPSDRDSVSREFRAWIEQAGLNPRFVFTGMTDRVPDYLRAMDIFVLPSYREGFPRSVLEAMATELPVVATDIRGCREAVVHGQTGLLVPVGDSAALTEAVLRLVQDRDARLRMGRAGRDRVAANFDQDTMTQRFVEAACATMSARHADSDCTGRRMRKAGVYERWGKRALDLTLAAVALLLLSPVFLLVAAGVWLCMGHPVLFQQRRAGRLGKPFTLYKFRTMTGERGPDGRLLPDQVRLTPLGRFLRSTSLDELPNLWNVLNGDMSLVGPRPLPIEYVPLYSPDQARRLDVRPGLVSLNGLYDRSGQPWEKMFHYDVLYTQRITLREDLRILFGMIPVVLSRNGIHRGRHDENSDFARRLRAMQSGEGSSVPR